MTVLFSDGFESGDFSAWTAVGNGQSVVADSHHGTYDMKIASGWGGAWCGAYKDFTGKSTVFARVYVKMSALPASGEFCRFMYFANGAMKVGSCGYWNNGGTRVWFIDLGSGGTYTWANTAATGTWICLELKEVISATVGELRLFIDGTERITQTGLNSGTTNISRVYVQTEGNPWFAADINFDCVVVADAYIGPEGVAEGQPYISRVQGVSGMNSWTRQAKAYSKRMPIPIARRF